MVTYETFQSEESLMKKHDLGDKHWSDSKGEAYTQEQNYMLYIGNPLVSAWNFLNLSSSSNFSISSWCIDNYK